MNHGHEGNGDLVLLLLDILVTCRKQVLGVSPDYNS